MSGERRVGIDELVALLCRGVSQRRIYFGDHPNVVAVSEDFTRALRQLLATEARDACFLGVAEGKLVYEGRFLLGASIVGRKIIDFVGGLHSGGLLFRADLAPAEVRELLGLAADAVPDLEEARRLLASRGVSHVELSPVYEDERWFGQFLFEGELDGDGEGLGDLIPVYQSLFGAVEEAHESAGAKRSVDLAGARSVSEQLLRSTQRGSPDLMQLVRYPDHDSYTVGHSVRVAMLAVLVGRHLGMPNDFLKELGTAGLLHDVGKGQIPAEILYKPGRLDDEERRVMQSHPELGARVLLESGGAGPLAVAAAWGHHRRHDHGGYPPAPFWVIRGEATALLHVCDVFEALTAVRPYKPAIPPRRAYEIMLADRGAFHPGALRAFVGALGLYPPGSRVLLSSGEQAVVVAAGEDIARPRLRLTHDAAGAPVGDEDARHVDLGDPLAAGLDVTRYLMEEAPGGAPAT
ncbi:MAG: HD domain-containing protein [Candidatus Krumholzibacteriota bacterium]|nr:HD domain-containing protein [Candidatus Krumholzibacteriota bacterium]